MHTYTWVRVIEPTLESDGLERCQCSCGAVEAETVIPAGIAYVKGICEQVENAPEGGSVIYDAGRNYCLSDKMIDKFGKRGDVAITIFFTYDNKKYTFTIPA